VNAPGAAGASTAKEGRGEVTAAVRSAVVPAVVRVLWNDLRPIVGRDDDGGEGVSIVFVWWSLVGSDDDAWRREAVVRLQLPFANGCIIALGWLNAMVVDIPKNSVPTLGSNNIIVWL